MKTPPWKLIVPTVCFDLCKYKKSDTDPTLYRLHYSELLESFTDYTHIFTDVSKDGDKTAAAFICQSFEFSKRLPDKASIFTAELEAIVSALRYIKITTKNNKFVVFGDSESALQALLSKWDHPTVQTIMRFLVFLHTVHKTVIFCWLPSHIGISGNERADSAAKAALQKDVSNCLISYTATYQYISQYVRDMWQREWDTAVNNKLHATKPLIGEQPSTYRSVRRDEVVLSRLRFGHSYLTHSYLLKGDPSPECVTCNCRLTNYQSYIGRLYPATRGNNKILRTPSPHIISSEELLPGIPCRTRRTHAQLRTNKSPFLKSYLFTQSRRQITSIATMPPL